MPYFISYFTVKLTCKSTRGAILLFLYGSLMCYIESFSYACKNLRLERGQLKLALRHAGLWMSQDSR